MKLMAMFLVALMSLPPSALASTVEDVATPSIEQDLQSEFVSTTQTVKNTKQQVKAGLRTAFLVGLASIGFIAAWGHFKFHRADSADADAQADADDNFVIENKCAALSGITLGLATVVLVLTDYADIMGYLKVRHLAQKIGRKPANPLVALKAQ